MTLHRSPKGILGGPVDGPERLAASYPPVEAITDTLTLHRGSGFAGRIVSFTDSNVVLRGSTGLEQTFRVVPGAFAVDGHECRLVAPRPRAEPDGPDLRGGTVLAGQRTASGSRVVHGAPARIARTNRIFVEGKHDAELIEKVWGDDLRIEGIVVEILDGVDNLDAAIREFRPGPKRRLGVLVDHLVPGSLEARVAAVVTNPNVLVLGTPFIDIWAAIRPKVAGIDAWPTIPMGTNWKVGICAALGEHDPPEFWRTLLAKVNHWGDVDQTLVGAVEQLIDFVTTPD